MTNVKAKTALKRMKVLNLLVQASNLSEELSLKFLKIEDSLDSLNLEELEHRERMITQLLVILEANAFEE